MHTLLLCVETIIKLMLLLAQRAFGEMCLVHDEQSALCTVSTTRVVYRNHHDE